MKEDTRVDGPWEFGEKPVRRNTKQDWDVVLAHAKSGNFDEIPADIFYRHYTNTKQIAKDFMKKGPDCPHLRGIWIYGPSGVGKSVYARQHYPDAYPKNVNKWWCGYQGEPNVIMDDMAPEHDKLATHLKHWGDHQQCTLETKGSQLMSKHEWFVVTSQFTIA